MSKTQARKDTEFLTLTGFSNMKPTALICELGSLISDLEELTKTVDHVLEASRKEGNQHNLGVTRDGERTHFYL